MRDPRDWRRVEREVLFDHSLFDLTRRRLTAPDGPEERRALVIESRDWVNVIALTSGAPPRVVLIRQFRYGTEKITLEIPGGIVEHGEDPADTARRELLEETGYTADRFHLLGQVEPNPAILDNRCTSWLAEGARRTERPSGDGDEEIEVIEVPLPEVRALIARGQIQHSLVVSAFHFLALRQEDPPS